MHGGARLLGGGVRFLPPLSNLKYRIPNRTDTADSFSRTVQVRVRGDHGAGARRQLYGRVRQLHAQRLEQTVRQRTTRNVQAARASRPTKSDTQSSDSANLSALFERFAERVRPIRRLYFASERPQLLICLWRSSRQPMERAGFHVRMRRVWAIQVEARHQPRPSHGEPRHTQRTFSERVPQTPLMGPLVARHTPDGTLRTLGGLRRLSTQSSATRSSLNALRRTYYVKLSHR